ncbi:hypothetical protein [Glycomyces salinus]|uniref:hypothetical protein n=1 Tax=Glycomyces salinus TaxID=980294 RepID=UPI0018EAB054|nr:hypothetical protein [Glycomyces salinus]
MSDDQQRRVDPDAIRDVAQVDLPEIAERLEEARIGFFRTEGHAGASFSGTSYVIEIIGDVGWDPFASVGEKWAEFTDGLASGLRESQVRILDAADALEKVAQDYDYTEDEIVTDFHSIGY